MRIIIAGAGEVGFHLAKLLADESQDIYLIDTNQDRLEYVQNHLDVFTVCGDSKSLATLREAKVESADLLIAVTSSEEINILVCILGKKLGAAQTIARVSNAEYLRCSEDVVFPELGVDNLISPTELASREILRLVKHNGVVEHFEFEQGKLTLIGVCIEENAPIKNRSIKEIGEKYPNLSFMPVAINRDSGSIVPNGNTTLQVKDIVYFLTVKESLKGVFAMTGTEEIPIKNVMILGGSRIGMLTAESLQKDYSVILIEQNRDKSLALADRLKSTLIINSDGTDVTSLEDEGIADMDVFIAVTGDSETNIMSCLVAKKHGVKKTIAQVENMYYINLSHNIGIDTLINKKVIAAGNIFRFIRKGHVSALANLHGMDAEMIEYEVREGAKVTKNIIRDLKFPIESRIAGVVRNDIGIIPLGGFLIRPGDKVVVFSTTDNIPKVEEFFK